MSMRHGAKLSTALCCYSRRSHPHISDLCTDLNLPVRRYAPPTVYPQQEKSISATHRGSERTPRTVLGISCVWQSDELQSPISTSLGTPPLFPNCGPPIVSVHLFPMLPVRASTDNAAHSQKLRLRQRAPGRRTSARGGLCGGKSVISISRNSAPLTLPWEYRCGGRCGRAIGTS